MDVSLLYVEGCPNLHVAAERLREALARVGRGDVEVAHREVRTPDEADALQFRGSPAVLSTAGTPFRTWTARSACPAGSTEPATA
ncbi:hypothetical protein SAMN05661080_04765 [Modestobacter sp. DSM 44400]|nr:hypothetical protein SAMN05661080_04765 [Modestobacter sp. DSM 44400]